MRTSLFANMLLMAVVATAAEPVQITNVNDAYPVPSPDGRLIMFQSNRSGVWQFYTCRTDGSELRQTGTFTFPVAGPSWSPDGRRVAFAGEPDGDSEIFVMNSDGSGIVRLTSSPGDDAHPHWSPDGTRIMFNSARTTPDRTADWSRQWHEIFSMKVDGTDLRQHTRCRTVCTYGSFAPDMKRIAYRKVVDAAGLQWDLTAGARNSEIFVADADGANERNVSNNAAFDGWPVWSPDGERIAFASNRAGPANVGQLYTVKPDGSALTRVTNGTVSHVQPAWSPDGRSLYANQSMETAEGEYGAVVRVEVPSLRAAAGQQFWAIAVRDLATAEWYERNFGMRVTHSMTAPDQSSQVRILENDAAVIEVQHHRDAVPRQSLRPGIRDYEVHGYFKVGWFVPDLGAEHARLVANGAQVRLAPVTQKDFGIRFFMVADPEGNLIQLFERLR
jgi:TolB protein